MTQVKEDFISERFVVPEVVSWTLGALALYVDKPTIQQNQQYFRIEYYLPKNV